MTGTGLPLDGVRVVEMTHMVMGPSCGMVLAQLGQQQALEHVDGQHAAPKLDGLDLGGLGRGQHLVKGSGDALEAAQTLDLLALHQHVDQG